jgi:hypothetical protein
MTGDAGVPRAMKSRGFFFPSVNEDGSTIDL